MKVSFLSLRKGNERAIPCHITIHDQVAVIGREASDLILEDKLVSRQHVALVVQNNEVIARDLNSRNGLFVNGRRVLERPLKIGDKVDLGGHQLTVTHITSDAEHEVLPEADVERTIAGEIAAADSDENGQKEYLEKQPTNPSLEEVKRAVMHGWPGAFACLPKEKQQKFDEFVPREKSSRRR